MAHGWNHACHDTWKEAAEPDAVPRAPSPSAWSALSHSLPVPLSCAPSTRRQASSVSIFQGVPSGAPGSGFPMSADGWPQTQLVGPAPQPGSRGPGGYTACPSRRPRCRPPARVLGASGQPGPPQAVRGAFREARPLIRTLRPGLRRQHVIVILSREVATMRTAKRMESKVAKRCLRPASQLFSSIICEPFPQDHPFIIIFLWWSHINSWGNGRVFRIPGFYYAPRVAHAHISPSSHPGARVLGSPFRALLPDVLLHWDPQRGKGRKDLLLDFTQRHQDSTLLSPDLQREQRTGRWPKVGASPRP